ncbi:MAG: hypothetical protein LBG19_03125 [Prevotellaceae bacterium]|nr:hypothetical protein [Prevotellaceae bacterium]
MWFSFEFEAVIQYELHTASGRLKWYIDDAIVTSATNQRTWVQPYLSGGEHKVKLVIKDKDGVEEVLETTLKVECATLIATIIIKDISTVVQKTLTLSVSPAAIFEPHAGITPSPTQATVIVNLPSRYYPSGHGNTYFVGLYRLNSNLSSRF